ncbi:MAG: hypothetical protein AAF636_01105 [Pseudomonadota bacterium]
MPAVTIEQSRLRDGVWECLLRARLRPQVAAHLHDKPLEPPQVEPAGSDGLWRLTLTLPKDLLSDGAHTVVLTEGAASDPFGNIAILAGDVLASDLRAEVDLLRAELNMLKRMFRKHHRDQSNV